MTMFPINRRRNPARLHGLKPVDGKKRKRYFMRRRPPIVKRKWNVTEIPIIPLPSNASSNMDALKQRVNGHLETPNCRQPARKMKQQRLTPLMEAICGGAFRLSLLDSSYFKEFIHMLNPSYNIPSSDTVSKTILPTVFEECANNVMITLDNSSNVALSIAGWTSQDGVSFFTIVAHLTTIYSNREHSLFLACGDFGVDSTAEEIALWLDDVAMKFDFDGRIDCIVTDHNPKLIDAMTLSKSNFAHFCCFEISFGFVIEKALHDVLQPKVESVNEFLKWFITNAKAVMELGEAQLKYGLSNEQRKLDDGPGNWQSTLDLLNWFQSNKLAIISALDASQISFSWTERDWIVLEQSLKILSLCRHAFDRICSEKYFALSIMNVVSKELKRKFTGFMQDTELLAEVNALVRVLDGALNEKLEDVWNSPLVAETTLLDPRIKQYGFTCKDAEYNAAYESVVEKLIECHSLNGFMTTKCDANLSDPLLGDLRQRIAEKRNLESAAKHELDSYLGACCLDLDANPVAWLSYYERNYEGIFQLAAKTIAIPVKVTHSGEKFSNLAPDNIEKLFELYPRNWKEILFIDQNIRVDVERPTN
ncbi:uncharacterized protein LOC131271995 [Anopheles coustani]|uniref:uncharacterized protein LOC131271995 n=1 Tax=Anopheles coustani TaxID=139045 RepID=UPI002659BF8F|nr:uncharacterized protein LOC131271995 [Anopheles coustani]